MSPFARQSLSAAGLFTIIAVLSGGAISAAFALWHEQANLAALTAEDHALQARARRVEPNRRSATIASPFIKANTITQAGAKLLQTVENAVSAAGGILTSSRVDVGAGGDKRRVALDAELTISQPAMQKLLYKLETGEPYLFVEAFEARATQGYAQNADRTQVSFTISGEWSGPQ